MHKMLHPKADVEKLDIPRKNKSRSLINAETTFKTETIGLDHHVKHKEGYPKKVLNHERSKAKNQYSKTLLNLKGK